MMLHFISTANRFCYLHMIAVLSAIKYHKADQIFFWLAEEPTGIYWAKVKPLVQIRTFQNPDLPALKNQTEAFKATHIKDYIQWQILCDNGGLFLDLDTISVGDSTHWGSQHADLLVSLDVDNPASIPFPYNNAVVLATANSDVAKLMKYYSHALMQQKDITWGMTGPILLSLMSNVKTHRGVKNVMSTAHRIFCPFGGNEISRIYEENPKLELPPKTEVIHLYAKASEMFEKVDATFVRNSQSLLARTIRKILPESDWDVSMWDEQYLRDRGQHYAGLFKAIREHKPKTILEIGTSSGVTAIGMIRMAGLLAPESDIVYWGVDLFENGTDDVWEKEFTGGYRPPKLGMVYDRLRQETKARIKLIAVDSNHLQPKDFEEMGVPDLIYIDGGHSLETIRHDWLLAEKISGRSTVIVFDDYFAEMPFIGCKQIVDSIDTLLFNVKIMPETDDYAHSFGRLRTQLVVVTSSTVTGPVGDTGPIEKDDSTEYRPWAKDIMERVNYP